MQWQVSITARAGRPVTDDEFIAITDKLEEYAAAVGAAPGDPSSVDVVLAIDARTLRSAFDAAIRLVVGTASDAGVPGVAAVAAEAIEFEEAERRVLAPAVPELVGISEIAGLLGVTKQRANQLVTEHKDFPRPAQQLAAGKLWPKSAVEAWASTWTRRRTGRPRKSA
ncbi:MAG: hypothetical protein JWM93_2480 [Frankiales bacterium]|nr:hypothetical protein [Frankiales bacterium]